MNNTIDAIAEEGQASTGTSGHSVCTEGTTTTAALEPMAWQ
jgi:hypothetical protein